MKRNILFIDEHSYRFNHYYNSEEWWCENGIVSIRKSYKQDGILSVLKALVFQKVDSIVFVQLSNKNLLLCLLCNFLNVKTVMFQHGLFLYPVKTNKFLHKFKPCLSTLLYFSDHDKVEISSVFKSVSNNHAIPHYEIEKYSQLKRKEDDVIRVLFIGQIIFKEQIEMSSSLWEYDEKAQMQFDFLLNELEKKNRTNKIELVLKKHPGDKSDYFESLANKFSFIKLETSSDNYIPDLVIGHFSTLIIAYIQLKIRTYIMSYQLEDQLDLNFDIEKNSFVTKIREIEDVKNIIFFKEKNRDLNCNWKFSISEKLLEVL